MATKPQLNLSAFMHRQQIEGAARMHQRANKSDPFAYGRIKLHMQNGYEEPDTVFSEASNICTARGDTFLEYGK